MLISDLSNTQLMLLVLPVIPNMWALKHCFHRDFPTEKEKYRWMMACIFLPCIGGIAYFLVGRKHASKEKIDVFERYKKETPAEAVAPSDAVSSVVDTVPAEAVETPAKSADDDLEYDERARAPWDEESAEEKMASASEAALDGKPQSEDLTETVPAPRKGEWDFGCPDDVRKN